MSSESRFRMSKFLFEVNRFLSMSLTLPGDSGRAFKAGTGSAPRTTRTWASMGSPSSPSRTPCTAYSLPSGSPASSSSVSRAEFIHFTCLHAPVPSVPLIQTRSGSRGAVPSGASTRRFPFCEQATTNSRAAMPKSSREFMAERRTRAVVNAPVSGRSMPGGRWRSQGSRGCRAARRSERLSDA